MIAPGKEICDDVVSNKINNYELNNARKDQRFKLSATAEIITLVYDNYSYRLFKPFSVKLIDVSQHGARIRTSLNALPGDCKFEMRFKINGKYKRMLSEVVHESHIGNGTSEYGCHFYPNKKLIPRIAL